MRATSILVLFQVVVNPWICCQIYKKAQALSLLL